MATLSPNNIKYLIVHCTATARGKDFTAADVDRWHRQQGWNMIGYHYLVRLDGTIEKGRPETMQGAHCKGYNYQSLGICYVGGLDAQGRRPEEGVHDRVDQHVGVGVAVEALLVGDVHAADDQQDHTHFIKGLHAVSSFFYGPKGRPWG